VTGVARALLTSPYRSELEPKRREQLCFKRALLLAPTEITADDVPELLNLCRSTPGVKDPEALFATLIERSVWREFRDRRTSLARHRAALGRGVSTRNRDRAEGPYGGTDPLPASSFVPTLLQRPHQA
jgi:hypothetical protein